MFESAKIAIWKMFLCQLISFGVHRNAWMGTTNTQSVSYIIWLVLQKASLFTVHGKETNFSTHYSTIKLNYIPSNDVKMLWELHSLPSISHSSHSYKLYITILCCTYSVLHDIFISFVNQRMVEMEFVLSMNARTFFSPLLL